VLSRIARRATYANVVSTLALFLVVAGGSAYAVNTISSTDIIDGQVKSVDVGDGEIGSADVKDQSLSTFDVHTFLGADVVDGTLTGDDVSDDSTLGPADIHEEFLAFGDTLIQSDLATDSVASDEVEDDSLTGADINENTLSLPAQDPAGFAGANDVALPDNNSYTPVVTKALPQGNYAVTATVTFSGVSFNGGGPAVRNVGCRIQNPSNSGQASTDRRPVPVGDFVERTLSVVGAVSAPAGGGSVTIECSSMTQDEFVKTAQIIVTKVASFF
jgi:hypothetical protein